MWPDHVARATMWGPQMGRPCGIVVAFFTVKNATWRVMSGRTSNKRITSIRSSFHVEFMATHPVLPRPARESPKTTLEHRACLPLACTIFSDLVGSDDRTEVEYFSGRYFLDTHRSVAARASAPLRTLRTADIAAYQRAPTHTHRERELARARAREREREREREHLCRSSAECPPWGTSNLLPRQSLF